jgi:hypothetical protein
MYITINGGAQPALIMVIMTMVMMVKGRCRRRQLYSRGEVRKAPRVCELGSVWMVVMECGVHGRCLQLLLLLVLMVTVVVVVLGEWKGVCSSST